MSEYGLVIPQGVVAVKRQLPLHFEDGSNELTSPSREIFADLYVQLQRLEEEIKRYDQKLKTIVHANDSCKRLTTLPGVGPTIATALLMAVGDAKEFKNGRHLAAWLAWPCA